jgi:CBS-domain-containing membrane protein
MKARDVMATPVITVKPSSLVQDVARLLLGRRISAVPVIDDDGRLVGIVSEGDLIRRAEVGTERRHSWWLRLLTGSDALAGDYVKAHARSVADIMTRDVITVGPETPLSEIATLLERKAIKRVPVVQDGQVVGIVSRANLVQAVASVRKDIEISRTDAELRDQLLALLRAQPWAHTALLNVTVADGVVDLWGMVPSETERRALRVAAEGVAGVRAVNDNLVVRPHGIGE